MHAPNAMIAIPVELLEASQNKEKYFELHLKYLQQHECKTDAEAWELLEADLEKYGLGRRYSDVKYFYEMRRKMYLEAKPV